MCVCVFIAKCLFKILMRNTNFLLQVSWFSRSCQTTNTLDFISNPVKKIQHAFTSWRRKPRRNRTLSEDSVAEDNHFNPPGKSRTGDPNGLQTHQTLHVPSECNKPAVTSDNLTYEAESPDEAALVYAAKAYGFTLLARSPDSVTVRLPSGNDLVFEVLDTLAFDSNRKRMSVLVRHPITRERVLYTKGADYAIMELLGTPYAGMCK